jgi:hypothetical protein
MSVKPDITGDGRSRPALEMRIDVVDHRVSPALAFAPLHKAALGVAVGTAAACLVLAFTVFHLLVNPHWDGAPRLLGEYFYGYSASPRGLIVGPLWGFVVGFVMGWFVAFCRNLAMAISVFVLRTRAELAQTRDFLDHI